MSAITEAVVRLVARERRHRPSKVAINSFTVAHWSTTPARNWATGCTPAPPPLLLATFEAQGAGIKEIPQEIVIEDSVEMVTT